jgi:hypothetical protein
MPSKKQLFRRGHHVFSSFRRFFVNVILETRLSSMNRIFWTLKLDLGNATRRHKNDSNNEVARFRELTVSPNRGPSILCKCRDSEGVFDRFQNSQKRAR